MANIEFVKSAVTAEESSTVGLVLAIQSGVVPVANKSTLGFNDSKPVVNLNGAKPIAGAKIGNSVASGKFSKAFPGKAAKPGVGAKGGKTVLIYKCRKSGTGIRRNKSGFTTKSNPSAPGIPGTANVYSKAAKWVIGTVVTKPDLVSKLRNEEIVKDAVFSH